MAASKVRNLVRHPNGWSAEVAVGPNTMLCRRLDGAGWECHGMLDDTGAPMLRWTQVPWDVQSLTLPPISGPSEAALDAAIKILAEIPVSSAERPGL